MGQLIDGRWDTSWYDTKSTGGAFRRSTAGFRNWITPDGSAGTVRRRAVSPRKAGAITSTSPTPVPGRTAR